MEGARVESPDLIMRLSAQNIPSRSHPRRSRKAAGQIESVAWQQSRFEPAYTYLCQQSCGYFVYSTAKTE